MKFRFLFVRYFGGLRLLALLGVIAFASITALGQHEGHGTPVKPAPTPKPAPQRTQTPSPSPSPTPSPSPAHVHPSSPTPETHPMPTASPSPSPAHVHPDMPTPAASPGESRRIEEMQPANSPLVMAGNDMAVRIGKSDTNLMFLGQMGSGTSWQPISPQMHMNDKLAGDWLLMLHYNLVVGMNRQGGPRGVTKLDSANWLMPMAFRRLGKGSLQLRGMFSAEPFTFPPGGSPLLFQTGETYKGEPLIDRQHPHDLFMELSAQYTHPLGEHGTWFTYFGYPGEPALGPVAFMHRQSASENPSATLGHHLQDATHISFGVLTTGFTYRWFKIEGSIFNGREPDEGRYDFDAHKWNSRSARLWFMPNKNWALQISHGFLRSPEGNHAEIDIRRTTASVQYNRAFHRGNWAAAIVWGRNHLSGHDEVGNLNSYTAESTVNFLDKNYLYTRLELVDKDDLLRPDDRALLGIAQHHPVFRIGGYTFGGVRDVWKADKVSVGIGSDVTFYSKPAVLDRLYGDNPVSWRLFVRIRPAAMDMSKPHSTHRTSGP